jgi:hypothetical protein
MVVFKQYKRIFMSNFITRAFQNIISDIKHLNSEQPNRVRGILKMTAAAVAAVGGVALSAAGGTLMASSALITATVVGIPLGIPAAAAGFALLLSGAPAGFFVGYKAACSGWTDLTRRRVTPLHV